MAWRSVIITQPAHLRLAQKALMVDNPEGSLRVPLEDISVLVIDQPQVSLTAQLLSACADQQIAVITVGASHLPNGVLLPYLPHSRATKVLRAQLAMGLPRKKRLWQHIVQRKITNQASVLAKYEWPGPAKQLLRLSMGVRSGDSGNTEAQAAQVYFRYLFGRGDPRGFTRSQDRLHNAAINYGYSVIRSALARQLVAYGFVTAYGLHHHSELNAFNLADDLLEPFRPILDDHILFHIPLDAAERALTRQDKANIVRVLHEDITLYREGGAQGRATVLYATELAVISLVSRLADDALFLDLPGLDPVGPLRLDTPYE